MLDVMAGFHNVPFEHASSYNSIFVTHCGKFRWLQIPMGLTQAPAHFQYVVEDVLRGSQDSWELSVIVYLDDIATYGDSQEQVLANTLKAIRRLTAAGFTIDLSKSQLVESSAKVLGHQWSSEGFWAPNVTKMTTLAKALDDQLTSMNRASLYWLLNFFREYYPTFAEGTELLRQLLGQDAQS